MSEFENFCCESCQRVRILEGNVYQTSTGRSTSPVPWFDGTFANNTKKFHAWLISESIAEAEHRNDWFNKIWLKGVKTIFGKREKDDALPEFQTKSLHRYLFDKEYIESQTYKRYLKRQAKRKGEKH